VSLASTGRRGAFMSGVIVQAQGRPTCSASRSAAVNTPSTPGACPAAAVSSVVIRACAIGLRTTER
jgi:hypothetical protein